MSAEQATGTRDRWEKHKRAVLAKAIMRAFDEWRLANVDRQLLLGLDPNSRAALGRYAQGRPLNNTRNLLDRVGHLLTIYRGLRILCPENPEICMGWLSSPNRCFDGKTPLDIA